MRKLFLILSIVYLLYSCSESEKKEEIKIDYPVELNQYFQTNYHKIVLPKINNIKIDSIDWLHTFYKNNNYNTIWIKDSLKVKEVGIKLIDHLSKSENYGIDSRLYAINKLLELKRNLERTNVLESKLGFASKIELLLTYYFMQHGKHLNYGLVSSIDSFSIIPRKLFDVKLPRYLSIANDSNKILENLLKLQPKHPQYHRLQRGLEYLLKNASLSTKNINVQNFRIDSSKAIKQAKKALVLHNYLPKKYNDSLYFEALTKFQTEHGLKPDSLIGNNTANALSVSPYRYYKQIVANLERWRWKNNWTSEYLYVNIPSFKMELYNNFNPERKHKVVVGKLSNQTPEIIDSIEYIIAYPYWNVPRSISVKEILVKAQKDTSYLKRNNYEILTYSRENLDPNSINWNEINEDNFTYLIRQKGGTTNALGLVKFIFPNKHAIYLHDTPTKYYFNQETRAYSHGCIRVQQALELADYSLKSDNNKYNLDSIFKYIDVQKEKPMKLNKKIPIHIYYFTASADNSGNVTFYNDIYEKDDKLITELSFNAN